MVNRKNYDTSKDIASKNSVANGWSVHRGSSLEQKSVSTLLPSFSYGFYTMGAKNKSTLKIPREVPLRLKHKPGNYSFFYRKVAPVDHKLITYFIRMKILSYFTHPLEYKHNSDLSKVCKDISKSFYFQLMRMVSALEFWEKFSPGNKIDTAFNVLKKSLISGEAYSEDIKKIFQLGMRTFHADPASGEYEYKGDTYLVDNYNYVPPLQFFILWKEKIEDYKWMFVKKEKKPSDEYLKLFEENLLDIIPPKIDDILDIELFKPSTSVSRSWDSSRNIFFKELIKYKKPVFKKDKITGYRTIIPVGPKNWRDGITLDMESYFTMRKVDLLVLQIISRLPTSVTCTNNLVAERRKNRIMNKRGVFLMRDIKKSGLTMPIKLLGPILRKVLVKKYPNKGFELIKALENLELIMEDRTRLLPKNGLGLGMGNNLWTLIQCLQFEILRSNIDFEIEGLFGNDDSLILIPDSDSYDADSLMYELIDIDRTICEGLGIRLSRTKTFSSKYPLFYEEYSLVGFRKKESRYIAALSTARLASSIYEAKVLVSSILSNVGRDDESIDRAASQVILEWGYEFFPDEIYLDVRLGGWIRKGSRELSSVLMDVYDSGVSSTKLRAAAEACKIQFSVKPKCDFDMFDDDRPLMGESKLLKSIPKDQLGGTEYFFMTRGELEKFFDSALKFSQNYELKIKKVYKLRERTYRNYVKRDINRRGLSIILKDMYDDLMIPRQEVVKTTRDYDFLVTSLPNRLDGVEDTIHARLCLLHEQGYIVYDDYYRRYESYRTLIKTCTSLEGRVQLEMNFKEYKRYSSNYTAVLTEWYHRHKGLDKHPGIPIFYEETSLDYSIEEEDIIKSTRSNLIVPLSSLWRRLKEHSSLGGILEINSALIDAEERWMINNGFFEKKEEIKYEQCMTHHRFNGARTPEDIVKNGLEPFYENRDYCPDCMKESREVEIVETLTQLKLNEEKIQQNKGNSLLLDYDDDIPLQDEENVEYYDDDLEYDDNNVYDEEDQDDYF